MKNSYDTSILKDGANKLGIEIDDIKERQFLTYCEMLLEWNDKINLTAITDPKDVMLKHFLDSVSMVRIFPELSDQRVIDIGTGAGFPGIPLKIAFPDIKLTLTDSVNKKLEFIRVLSGELGLNNVDIVHQRAEDLGRDPGYRQQFDICVSRAVSNLSTLSEYCLPFVKEGGIFISYKSEDSLQEIKEAENAIRLLGGEVEENIKFLLPGSDIKRRFVLIRKIKDTPKAYPRKAGTPAKKPL